MSRKVNPEAQGGAQWSVFLKIVPLMIVIVNAIMDYLNRH